MNTVISTCELELLSAYLDEELSADETARLEAHLETCHACQSRLDGLTRVSETLRSLERAAPPPILEELVLGRREVPGARSWSGRLAQMNEASRRTRSTIGLVFAMVLMLVVFVYLFSLAQSRQGPTSTVISVTSDQLRGVAATEPEWIRVGSSDAVEPATFEAWRSVVGVDEVWRHPDVAVAALADLESLTCAGDAAASVETAVSHVAVLTMEQGELRCTRRLAPTP